MKKKKYDTSVVFLYTTGREHLLPKKFRAQIPYTTISAWRRIDHRSYIGHEFRKYFEQAFGDLETLVKYDSLKNTMHALMRSWIRLRPLLFPILKNAGNDKRTQTDMLKTLQRLQDSIGLERTLKMTGISYALYRQWVLESQADCFDSYTAVCTKRHPHQLSLDEVMKIRKMLSCQEYDHWPIVSVASHGLRTGSMVASLYSWYKYARLLGISKKATKKDRKTIGLLAERANEYWHVDTTFYPLTDGREVCIAFVMDNFSKMILGYHVTNRRSWFVVRRVLKNALQVAMQHPEQKESVLVTDGGTENHNRRVDQFIEKLSGYRIKKIRALKDIRFSNSPVEAVHRTIKGRYLKNRKFESLRSLQKYLEWAVKDYNELRPHYKHRPKTPMEVYFNKSLGFDQKLRIKKALRQRLKVNKGVKCIQCKGIRFEKACKDLPGKC